LGVVVILPSSHEPMAETSKPNVLVLGGCGFIGRNLVKYLVDNALAKHIRVVDKVLPTVAYLSPAHKEAFAAPIVKFKQGNAQSPGT
jgi:nucleoside-diphosphate-sugar epimerase